jgi:multidrug efflux pump subunit AcrB
VKFDTTRFVAATIKEIGVSLALTLLAVVVVVSLFLQSWRATLIVALAIPVSLIGTFAVLYRWATAPIPSACSRLFSP